MLKYFIYNKELDYKRGFVKNMVYNRDGIAIEADSSDNYGCFISRIMDGQENDLCWHRFFMEMKGQIKAPYRISFYSTNSLEIMVDSKYIRLEDILYTDKFTIERKKELISSFLGKMQQDNSDVLLHDIKGRYLWFILEVYRQTKQDTIFSQITLQFPRQSWIEYMPEVYQSNDKDGFLERYLGVFQSFYEDLNQKIKNMAYYLDVSSTEKEFLMWIAEWLDMTDTYMWSKEQLRRLLLQAVPTFKRRGTRQGVLNMVEIYTGETAYLVETAELESYVDDSEKEILYNRLYGTDENRFTVIISGDSLASAKEYQTLCKIIEEVKPAQTEVNLVMIKDYIFLDEYSYLGINSVLGKYRPVILDGFSLLPFSSVSDK